MSDIFVVIAGGLVFCVIIAYMIERADKRNMARRLESEFLQMSEKRQFEDNKKILRWELEDVLEQLEQQSDNIKRYSGGELPRLAQDDWSVGYICGFIDEFFLRTLPQSNSERLQQLTMLAFATVYPEGTAEERYDAIADLIRVTDVSFEEGLREGKADMLAFKYPELTHQSFKLPMSWFNHALPNLNV